MKKEILVTYVDHLYDNDPKGRVSIDTVIDRIRKPKEINRTKILQARMFGKGSNPYKQIKGTLPCFLFNFEVVGGVSGKNALESTGVMYLDIDWVSDESKEQLKKDLLSIPFLFSYWESTSGRGLSILIRVDGMTVNNFGHFSQFIKKNYPFDWDKNCFSVTRKTSISYDENIYVNHNCEILTYERVQSSVIIDSKQYISSIGSIERDMVITPNCTPNKTPNCTLTKHYIRYNNKKDFATNNAIEIYEDGVDVVEIQLNIKYKEGNRQNGLFKDGVKFLYLNPHVDTIEVFNHHLHYLNRKKCQPMLENNEIAILAKKIFKERGNYKPLTRKKKYIANRDIIIDPRDVQSQVAKLVAADKRESTLNHLKSLYIPGMTQKQLMKESEMSLRTIKTYWKELM